MPSAYAFSPHAVRARHARVDRGGRAATAATRASSTWVPLNESWGVPRSRSDPAQRRLATALYHLTKALDPTRPVIANDGWEHTRGDILGVHDYARRAGCSAERYRDAEAIDRAVGDRSAGRAPRAARAPRDRGQPVVLTEFGGIS